MSTTKSSFNLNQFSFRPEPAGFRPEPLVFDLNPSAFDLTHPANDFAYDRSRTPFLQLARSFDESTAFIIFTESVGEDRHTFFPCSCVMFDLSNSSSCAFTIWDVRSEIFHS